MTRTVPSFMHDSCINHEAPPEFQLLARTVKWMRFEVVPQIWWLSEFAPDGSLATELSIRLAQARVSFRVDTAERARQRGNGTCRCAKSVSRFLRVFNQVNTPTEFISYGDLLYERDKKRNSMRVNIREDIQYIM